jgi:SAM-dependent methyltransferase
MAWNGIWEKVFSTGAWGSYPSEDLIRFTAANFYARKRDEVRLLEVGCGPGANLWYLSREGFDVYGIDGSASAIRRASERLRAEGLGASLITGDIMNLPYDDTFFDAVIDNECLYSNTARDTNIILKGIHRCLKEGGLLYSRTFTERMHIGHSQKVVGHLEYDAVSDGPFSGKGFARLIDRKGIDALYGKCFSLLTVDRLEYTRNNEQMLISEWLITARKI